MIEAGVEKPICLWAEEDGWLVRKLQYPNRKGAPDRMFVKDGRVVFIEFKRPSSGKMKDMRSELQKREAERLIEADAEYHLIDNIEHACRVLGIKNRAATPRPVRSSKRASVL